MNLPKKYFSSKVHTLELLRNELRTAKVLPCVFFNSIEWIHDSETILGKVNEHNALLEKVIVRSSCTLEDASTGSNAGAFLSQIAIKNTSSLIIAINNVLESYGRKSSEDYIFIQPYLADTMVSGVAFNREPQTGAFYDVVNYTLTTDTAAVTSGCGKDIRTYVSFCNEEIYDESISKVISLLRELETLVGNIALDVEFAINKQGQLVILQVRPLVSIPAPIVSKEKHHSILKEAQIFLKKTLSQDSNLLGKRSILGVMPDWNPAEIIGLKPRPLALSLYRYLITDSVWAKGRSQYGYRDTNGVPLMMSLYGLPYIDVRASFNSFIPQSLDNDIAEKLVNSCIERLVLNPSLHDKVEFEVIPTCYSFEIKEKLSTLGVLTLEDKKAITSALAQVTKSFIVGEGRKQMAHEEINLNLLRNLQTKVINSNADTIATIYQLLYDCKRLGTNSFAGLARAAFIGTDLLRSAVKIGLISEQTSSELLLSLDTPTSRFLQDLSHLSRERFLNIYGHLRPGTYDIRVPSYSDNPEQYFTSKIKTAKDSLKKWEMPTHEEKAMNKYLSDEGFDIDAQTLIEFIRYAIAARERAKFIFSRSISYSLDLIAEIGMEHGLSREELSFSNIFDILETRVNCCFSIKSALQASVDKGYKQYQITSQLNFPSIITQPEDIMQFEVMSSKPNFITNKIAEGRVIEDIQEKQLEGIIVMIPNADPGFDWLFSHNIAGFITAFGGSNSHMAIRAAELEMPAIIGAGEALYSKWVSADYLRLDCASGKVEVLS